MSDEPRQKQQQDSTGPNIQSFGRNNLLKPESEGAQEVSYLNALRPTKLQDYVGQKEVISNIEIALQAAKLRKEPLDHILFDGPPGLGKTTLAHIIASEMDAQLTLTSGPALDKGGALVGILTRLKHGDILFVDEIHRLPRVVEEFLYPAMEDRRIDISIDQGPHARSVTFQLQHFTLIGATTRKGLLTAPLRERFGIQQHLRFYDEEELQAIVMRSGELLDVEVDDAGAFEIARRSRGTPRIANRLLHRVRDYAQVKADGRVNAVVADRALQRLGVDALGLDDLDRRLLRLIVEHYDGGPVGLNAMAATLQEEADTLTDVVEPFLLKIGFLARTPRGRMVTRKACEHLGVPIPHALAGDRSALDTEEDGAEQSELW